MPNLTLLCLAHYKGLEAFCFWVVHPSVCPSFKVTKEPRWANIQFWGISPLRKQEASFVNVKKDLLEQCSAVVKISGPKVKV